MEKDKLRWVVTGANGYLGSNLVTYLRQRNQYVYALKHLRQKPLLPHSEFVIPYSLEAEVDKLLFDDIDVLVHCAYDFRWINWKDILRVNVEGSLRILKTAKSQGVKNIIFISTMSSFKGCKSNYGKAKLEVEHELSELGVVVIRPGLIFGKNPRSMVGALSNAVSVSKIVPLIGRGNQVLYLVHVEDLCKLVYKIGIGKTSVTFNPIIAAHKNGKTLKNILEILATINNKKLIFIPIPWRLIWLGLKISEMLGISLGFRSDSLIGLIYGNPRPDFETMKKTGITLQEFDSNGIVSK